MKDERSLMVWKGKPVRMILNWHFFPPMASRELLVLLLLTGFNHSLISYDFHYVIIVNFRVIQTIKDENRKKNQAEAFKMLFWCHSGPHHLPYTVYVPNLDLITIQIWSFTTWIYRKFIYIDIIDIYQYVNMVFLIFLDLLVYFSPSKLQKLLNWN